MPFYIIGCGIATIGLLPFIESTFSIITLFSCGVVLIACGITLFDFNKKEKLKNDVSM